MNSLSTASPIQVVAVAFQLLVFVAAAFYAFRIRKTSLLVTFLLPTLIFSWQGFVFLAAMLASIFGASVFSFIEPVVLIVVTVVIPMGCSYALLHQR
jgi:hypothetical protein